MDLQKCPLQLFLENVNSLYMGKNVKTFICADKGGIQGW
jgi:hypothetical protein